ncbi:hypothetical protein PVNG_05802 [Plasmodium vivax North Korean]|uniref:VIR protein n=1 Tax=Plasmodium vivax North Korean TaxID=1035514 RepID=A0A0J9TLY5_PLAVI|nr:hypothetical protein PVNG_05802 [Plasmodium vivax North Korean]
MQCDRPQNAYFDYGCYYELKEYFDRCKIGAFVEDFLKLYKEPKNANRNIFNSNKNLFIELVTRLGGDSLFMRHGTGMCCKYINYWLNDKLTTEYTNLDKSDFTVFRHFVDEYKKYRKLGSIHKDKCSDYIEPLLGTKKYTRMRILYEIYSVYEKIKKIVHLNHNKSRICSDFSLIVNFYKTLLREHQGDVYLNNRLEFFKELLVSNGDQYNELCNINLSNLLPKPVIPKSYLTYYTTRRPMLQARLPSNIERPKVVPTNVETVTIQKVTLPEEPKQSELEAKTETEVPKELEETAETKAEKELEEIIGQDMKETLGREIDVTIIKHLEEQLTQVSVDEPQEEVVEQIGEGVVDIPVDFQEGLQVDRSEKLDHNVNIFNGHDSSYMHFLPYTNRTTGQEYTTINHQSASLNDKEGFIDNVKSTFSSIVQNVEPAPVLGVSGGMGVLFLLFKVFIILKIYPYAYNKFK